MNVDPLAKLALVAIILMVSLGAAIGRFSHHPEAPPCDIRTAHLAVGHSDIDRTVDDLGNAIYVTNLGEIEVIATGCDTTTGEEPDG